MLQGTLSSVKQSWLRKKHTESCHGDRCQILCKVYSTCLLALYLPACRLWSHTACNRMQTSHANPKVMNTILLKALMGPCGIMNTGGREEAFAATLGTYAGTQFNRCTANSTVQRRVAAYETNWQAACDRWITMWSNLASRREILQPVFCLPRWSCGAQPCVTLSISRRSLTVTVSYFWRSDVKDY